jgi:dipeptidyl-peptidase-4
MTKTAPVIGLLIVALPSATRAADEKEDPSLLSAARIFASKELDPQPFSARWLDNSSAYVTLEASPGTTGGKDIVAWEPESGEKQIMVPAARLVPPGKSAPLAIDGYAFSRDRSLVLIYTNSKRVWRRNTRGDYWVLDRASHELRQLGGDAQPSTLMFAKLSPTGLHAAYVRENNIYLEDLRSHEITPLTTSGGDEIINGTFDWVYEEELGLRDGFAWSPDGKRIAYWQIDTHGVREFTMINNTDGLYPRFVRFKYPKVGQRNSLCRVGVVGIDDRTTRWLQVPGDPREHYIARMAWAGNSDEIILQQLNRLQNTNRVMLANAQSGSVKSVLTERDDAWVSVHDELMWLADGGRFTWVSERDGWRHGYLASRDGQTIACATPGDYDVIRLLHVDEQRGWLYFLASPDNPTRKYLFRTRLDGSELTRVTPTGEGHWHEYDISPNGRWAIHTWSSFGMPPRTELIELPWHKTVRLLVDNGAVGKHLAKLRQCRHEFFRVDIGDGVELDAWCILPPGLDPRKKYPLLIYVYGEPAGTTALDRWGGKGYLWHLMLAQRGYVVMNFENRGTPAWRGRDWRKCVYRKVGILAPADQAAALKTVLSERKYLDRERVGIWGWSGGGSMSLNAIFKYPDLYQTAMAVAPVPNQRLYDTIYQERYMGLPGDNVEGYSKGSPINYAHQLKGNLLIVHGSGDDNCHYQGTEKLINELIRHNKQFSMMAYPNRSHSIKEGPNTSRHLRALLTHYLMQNLPPGPR